MKVIQNFSLICQSMKEKTAENYVFPVFKVPKGAYNSYKNHRILMTLELELSSLNESQYKITARYVEA